MPSFSLSACQGRGPASERTVSLVQVNPIPWEERRAGQPPAWRIQWQEACCRQSRAALVRRRAGHRGLGRPCCCESGRAEWMHLEAHELHGEHKLFTRDAVVVPLAEVGDKPLGVREEALPKLPDLLWRSSVRARSGVARAKQERRAPHLRRQQRARGPERRARAWCLVRVCLHHEKQFRGRDVWTLFGALGVMRKLMGRVNSEKHC